MNNNYYKATEEKNICAEESANFESIKVTLQPAKPVKPATPPPNNQPKPKDK